MHFLLSVSQITSHKFYGRAGSPLRVHKDCLGWLFFISLCKVIAPFKDTVPDETNVGADARPNGVCENHRPLDELGCVLYSYLPGIFRRNLFLRASRLAPTGTRQLIVKRDRSYLPAVSVRGMVLNRAYVSAHH